MLASRVASVLPGTLHQAGVPAVVAARLLPAADFISQGVAPVPAGTPARLAQAITFSRAAFMSGLHLALVVAAILCFAGALLAPLIRRGAPGTGGPML